MPGLINGLFGDPQAQTIAAQQGQQQQAQQFNMQMFQQMMAQQQAQKQQAMQALQQFIGQNPNPAQSWGAIQGPNNTAPQTLGGGMIGPNAQPQGGAGQTPPMQGNPDLFRILAQIMGQQTKTPPPQFSLAPPQPAAPQPSAPAPSPGGPRRFPPQFGRGMEMN